MKPIKLALTATLFFCAATGGFAAEAGKWVGAWGLAPITLPAPPPQPAATATVVAPPAAPAATPSPSPAVPATAYTNVTVRHIVRLATGGNEVRVRFSNEFDSRGMKIGAAHLGLVGEDGAVIPGSDRPLTFNGGLTAITVPPFAPLISDPVALKVGARQALAISVYLPETVRIPAHRRLELYVAPGDQASSASLTEASTARLGALISQVHVRSTTTKAVIVALGDSITDGVSNGPLGFHSWPDRFADRVAKSPYAGKISVVNTGVGGGRLLREGTGPNALARFDRDVGSVPGVTHVILLEGINDIGAGMQRPGELATAEQLIGAYKQLIQRAHDRGLKIYGATLTPYEGAFYYDAAGEATRQALNAFIRAPGNFDGVIDFEKAVRDPAAPTKWAAGVQTGDNLHPNPAGYEAMAAAIDLKMFGVK